MNTSIKNQLIRLIAISTIAPLILFLILFFVFGTKISTEQSKKINTEKLLLIDQALTLYIEKIKHTINTIANNPIVVDLNTNELVTYRHWASWNEMTPFLNSQTEQDLYNYLRLVHLGNPDLGSVYIGTESGKYVMYPPSNRRPRYNPVERPWYLDAKEKKGITTVTTPFSSSDRNYQVFAVAKYLYFENSKEFGVVSANIDLPSITNIMSHFNLGQDSHIIITTEDNIIIANTMEPLTLFKNLDIDGLPGFYRELVKMDNNWEVINTGERTYNVKKVHSLGTPWILYAVVNRKEVLSPFRKTFYLLIICSLLILAIFLPLMIKSLAFLLIPLKKLSEHLYSLANEEGEALKTKIPFCASPDEIGGAIENYNFLLESLNNIFFKISEAKQLISSNNSKLSNQMLIISADITKNTSLIDNVEKKITEADNILKNIPEKQELDTCLKIIAEDISNIKKTAIDMNNNIYKGVEYNKSINNELSTISRIINVYKIRPPK